MRQFHLDGKPFSKPAGDWYLTDKNTDFAMKFLEEEKQKNPSKPIFLYFALNAPHNPLHALAKDVAIYRGKYKAKGWDVLRQERFDRQVNMGLIDPPSILSPRTPGIPAWKDLGSREQDIEDHVMAVYAGMMDNVDQNVGRMMAKLKELDMYDNTLFMFLSDNGSDGESHRGGQLNAPGSNWQRGSGWANLGNTPFRHYKFNQHNGGICTPFFAWWPNVIVSDKKIEKTFSGQIIDLMPTINELAGWKYPGKFASLPPLEGKSLVPLFEGKPIAPHEAIVAHLKGEESMISGNWKITSFKNDQWELYNLETDITENKDLSKQEPEILASMISKWNAYRKNHNISTGGGGRVAPYVPH